MVVEQHPITIALLNICFLGTLFVNQNILRGLEYIYIYIYIYIFIYIYIYIKSGFHAGDNDVLLCGAPFKKRSKYS